jgi:hypothetical protein
LTATTGGVRFEVHAKPRAKASRVVGVHGDALDLAVAAPPVDGAANDAIVRFLAERFGVPRASVHIVRGASSRVKLVEIAGVSLDAARAALP